MATSFAVVRNGAVWKCWDRLEQALSQAASVAAGTAHHESFHGFDADNKTAVVSRPVRVQVERLEDNRTVAILATWVAGEVA